MLIQMLTQQPSLAPEIVRGTPAWVWGLLAGLCALGASQLRTRAMSLTRLALFPVAMAGLSLSGTLSAFGGTSNLGLALVAWVLAASGAFLALATLLPHIELPFDARRRTLQVPGSTLPLLLILAIFAVKYVVGVELAMAPQQVADPAYALTVGGLYGAFSGTFAGRAWRNVRGAVASLRLAAA